MVVSLFSNLSQRKFCFVFLTRKKTLDPCFFPTSFLNVTIDWVTFLPTTQAKTLHLDVTRWSKPKSDWLYSLQPKMEKLYTVNKYKTRSWLCSDHEICIAKFTLKLKKVGKTTRPFRYDLNQIPYDYTVEVRNRFKGLDLLDRVPDELWNEVHDIVQETGIKTIPMEKKCKKAKWLSGRPYK